jgi:hypothetical protein
VTHVPKMAQQEDDAQPLGSREPGLALHSGRVYRRPFAAPGRERQTGRSWSQSDRVK